MRNKRGLPLIVVGLLLCAAALSIVAYNIWDDARAAKASNGILQELLSMIPEVEEQDTTVDPSEMVIPDYILNPKMDMPTLKVNEYGCIGYISIPAVSIELPVLAEWSYDNLKVSACRYTGTAYQNDMVIAAHNYRQHFGRLAYLAIGDDVTFTDIDGNVFHYTVGEMERLEPTMIQEMTENDWDLTLFTCTLGGQMRFTVRCALVEESYSPEFLTE